MSGLKASLRQAKECLARGEPREALQHCKAALKADKASYDAYVLTGKAAFLLGEAGQAELAYRKAVEVDAALLPAWKGLAELLASQMEPGPLIDALEHLVALAGGESGEKQREYQRKLADAHRRQCSHAGAAVALRAVLQLSGGADAAEALPTLCELADVLAHLSDPASQEERARLLLQISAQTRPQARHAAYHEAAVAAEVAALPPYAAVSGEWRETRQQLLQRLQAASDRSECCTPAYAEAALQLQEQLQGSDADSGEAAGEPAAEHKRRTVVRLAHAFPWRSAATVQLALLLHSREASQQGQPLRRAVRSRLLQALGPDMLRAAGIWRAWALAAQLALQTGQPQAAAALSADGLQQLAEATGAGSPPQPAVSSRLRLAAAEAQLQQGEHAAASAAFRALAEETKGLQRAPWAERQRLLALEGMAACALASGDAAAAGKLSGRVLAGPGLSEAGRGRLLCLQGWACFKSGDTQGAVAALERAAEALQQAGGGATDWQLGRAHLRLGRACWAAGGERRQDRRFAHRQWLAAAALDCPDQASAFAWLGTFYTEEAADSSRAQKCFRRALALEPGLQAAGVGLCRLLQQAGAQEQALAVCLEAQRRAPDAAWAWLRGGRLLLRLRRFPEAVAALQRGLRGAAGSAAAWEALGAAYQSAGRLTAAVKAYGQATALDPARTYSHVQAGSIQLGLGATAEAAAEFAKALEQRPGHLPALLGCAQALLASGRRHRHAGALGAAAGDLGKAEALAEAATRAQGSLRAAWKLLGDVRLLLAEVAPAPEGRQSAQQWANDALQGWRRRQATARAARVAHCKALHLAPHAGSHWGDAAAAELAAAELSRAHASLRPAAAVPALRRNAERLLRGGLRLEPACAPLWAALGCAAAHPAAREHALSRALQLDPKLVTAWAALGRLYLARGEAGLAERCFAAGRSQEPTAPAIWEGMAALAACSPTGGPERAACCEHALSLGAGTEAQLGFAESALRRGEGGSAAAFSAAARAASADHLNFGAHVAAGLTAEARGDAAAAAEAFSRALALLQRAGGPEAAAQADWLGCSHSLAVQGGALGMAAAVKVNLGRALAKAGRCPEAARVLEDAGVGPSSPAPVLLAFATALAGAGDAATAADLLQAALGAGPEPQVRAELAAALCRVRIQQRDLPAAGRLAAAELPRLLAAGAPLAVAQALPLALLAAAGAAGDWPAWQQARRLCALTAPAGADCVAAASSVEAAVARLQGQARQAARAASAALHAAPWSSALQAAQLAAAAATAGPAAAAAVARACSGLAACGPNERGSTAALPNGAWQALCVAGSRCLALLPPGDHCLPAAKGLLRWVHAEPHEPRTRAAAGLASLQAAARQRTAAAFARSAALLSAGQQVAAAVGSDATAAALAAALAECRLQQEALGAPADADGAELPEASALLKARLALVRGPPAVAGAELQTALQRLPAAEQPAAALSFAQTLLWAAARPEPGGREGLAEAAGAALSALDAALPQASGSALELPLLLAKAQLHLLGGAAEEAGVAAEAAVLAASEPDSLSPTAQQRLQISQLVLSAALLAVAAAADAPEAAASQARRATLAAASGADANTRVLAHVLAAEAEGVGGHKRRAERLQEHIEQALEAGGGSLPDHLMARIQPLLESAA